MMKVALFFCIIYWQGFVLAQEDASKASQGIEIKQADNIDKTATPLAANQEKQESRHSIEMNYLPGGTFNFPTVMAGTSIGNVTYNINSGFGIRYFMGYTKRHSWNALFGVGYDTARGVGAVNGQIGGIGFSGTGGGTHSSFQLHIRFDYRWEKWILDIGFNFCQPQNSGTPTAWNSMGGSIGTELGFQYAFTDEHLLSIQSRVITVSASPVGTTNLGIGTLSDMIIGFRYKF